VRKPRHGQTRLLPVSTCKVNLLYARVASQTSVDLDAQRETTSAIPLEPYDYNDARSGTGFVTSRMLTIQGLLRSW
jgi:hypothetical protein